MERRGDKGAPSVASVASAQVGRTSTAKRQQTSELLCAPSYTFCTMEMGVEPQQKWALNHVTRGRARPIFTVVIADSIASVNANRCALNAHPMRIVKALV